MSTHADDLVLSINGLCVEVAGSDGRAIPILKNVDLQLRAGHVLGLVGESGAGKSMLGLAAMGYVREGCRIASGRILFKGVDLAAASEIGKRALRGARIAYVAQSAAASFNPAHRLIDQCAEIAVQHGLKSKPEARAQAVVLYRQMHLPNPDRIGLRFPHQLSGGQLQRAMTAMAMSCQPDLIIFDEPTTALDVTTQVEVLAAIRNATRGSSTAAIFISHDLAVVAQMADRIMVLRHGVVIEDAGTPAILSSPKHDYTKSLWAVRLLASSERQTSKEHPLLALSDVCAGYRGASILQDISLAVVRGKTAAVVGESGSGKSTLARVITGLLPRRKGTVSFDGRPLSAGLERRSLDERRRIQLISQTADTAMNPRHRVGDIVGRPRQLYFREYGLALRKKVLDLLAMVELPADVISRFPAELSGGQKQRIGVARALAAEPDLIICDEITSGLDNIVARNILNLLLERQQERQIAYLFITHDFATVNAIADDVIVMLQGRIVEQGSKTRIMSAPNHSYTRALMACVPEMDPNWLDRRLAERGVADNAGAT